MRNHLLSLLVALLAVTGSLPVAAQEAYAVLTPNETLTFYYDNQRTTRQNYQHIYDMPSYSWDTPGWAGDYSTPQKNIKHVVFDASFAKYRPTSTSYWFSSCINLQDIEGIRNLNTENVTDMSGMFRNCQALTSLDLSNFNTQNVTSMFLMFENCKALTSLNLSNFNTENLIDMSFMFSYCEALTSLNVNNFNTQSVTEMESVFYGCTSLTNIFCNSNWEVGQNVKDEEMFYNCRQLKGTNTAFDANKTGIEMANPTTGYFTSLPVAAQEAYAVLTSDQTLTFYYDNQRATRQNYEHIYDMPKPGVPPTWTGDYYNPQRNIKHAVFDDSFSGYRPTSTNSWFEFCINLQDIEGIRNLNTEKVTNMSAMFDGCYALTSLDVSNFNTQNVTNMRAMFFACRTLTSLDVSNFNTQNVTSMGSMFYGCEALTSLDLSNFNTQNVTSMGSMFSACSALTSLDLSNFNTEKVTNMHRMFYGCQALRSLDVSNFNTQNVTDMSWIFSGCPFLTTIFCNSNWEDGYKYEPNMFNNCTQLKGTNTSYNPYETGIEMANPTTGYFTSKTTGIVHVKTDNRAGDGKAYDLSGRRVNESYKGIVIKNGKKYIQK